MSNSRLSAHQTTLFALLLLSLLLGLGTACESEPPPPNLRMQMFKVEYAEKQIAKSLQSPDSYPGIAARALEIAGLAEDTATFARYEAKPSYGLPTEGLENFRALRAALAERAGALADAANAGDSSAISLGYAQLKFTCETCHAQFRPGL